jgi:hypothetical protein
MDNGRLKEETTMATSITGGTAFDFGAAAQVTPQQPTTPVQRPTNVQPAADTVKLSEGAQVRLLKTQGQTISEIAINTALSSDAVNSYLGITPTPTAPAAASKT